MQKIQERHVFYLSVIARIKDKRNFILKRNIILLLMIPDFFFKSYKFLFLKSMKSTKKFFG